MMTRKKQPIGIQTELRKTQDEILNRNCRHLGIEGRTETTYKGRFSELIEWVCTKYTWPELERDFAPWLSGVGLEEGMRWSNGYSWQGEKVNNPIDILLYLDRRQLRNNWFETATPTMQAKGYAAQFTRQEVYLLGVEFSSQDRNTVRFDWKRAQ